MIPFVLACVMAGGKTFGGIYCAMSESRGNGSENCLSVGVIVALSLLSVIAFVQFYR